MSCEVRGVNGFGNLNECQKIEELILVWKFSCFGFLGNDSVLACNSYTMYAFYLAVRLASK